MLGLEDADGVAKACEMGRGLRIANLRVGDYNQYRNPCRHLEHLQWADNPPYTGATYVGICCQGLEK
jgi:hypothetical protein